MNETLVFLWVLVVGLCVGSFLNVVIYRFPITLKAGWKRDCDEFLDSLGERAPETSPNDASESALAGGPEPQTFNIAVPNSHCPACKASIPYWQNIPVISYLVLKGKCHSCKTKIPLRYISIEVFTAALTLLALYYFGPSAKFLFAALLLWALVALSFIDIDHTLLPDDIVLPLMWVGLLINIQSMFVDLQSAVIGAAAGYMILWSVFWLFKILRGKEGMGYGDFKLLAALGAWMGWQALPMIIVLSSLVGAVIGTISLIAAKKGADTKIPFGPYLAVAGVISLFWGSDITNFYLSIAR